MPVDGEYAPSPEKWVRDQVEAYEESDGKAGANLRGMPVVLLTTLGAKSGLVRKVPLMRVEHEGKYAAVASLGGAPKNPVWYYNLKAHPDLDLRDGEQTFAMTAREVTGAEYDQWWERAVAAYPDYADYKRKTDRVIPLFVLEPTS
ncbi:nitroreductase family deazaflavin-dependent oxidoreductase [Nakamurella sp. PAMC28650]|uniref:nitroreductase family deazaflavin-dependent oxidoreductase n=1 Tax=Nakamurella sp. PAMC28650 TaxID=2762325 RepID=UPI00164E0949|nr:nitroreductase family deazaflavin-dependent oxidoreductase [Nakamurella sp. PAMC28650]QNK81619.1 nitroreductase family deazaflavin-dependent oxidoreductase [Nakamurella sp. PAMC28650]